MSPKSTKRSSAPSVEEKLPRFAGTIDEVKGEKEFAN